MDGVWSVDIDFVPADGFAAQVCKLFNGENAPPPPNPAMASAEKVIGAVRNDAEDFEAAMRESAMLGARAIVKDVDDKIMRRGKYSPTVGEKVACEMFRLSDDGEAIEFRGHNFKSHNETITLDDLAPRAAQPAYIVMALKRAVATAIDRVHARSCQEATSKQRAVDSIIQSIKEPKDETSPF